MTPLTELPSTITDQRWLLVTPARDEAARLPLLAASLRAQRSQPIGLWVIVDDGSNDATGTCVDVSTLDFPVVTITRQRGSGLAGGGAFAAFFAGAQEGLRAFPTATHVMKLDADVILTDGFFAQLQLVGGAGILGGVVASGGADREQLDHIPGFVKGYSRAVFDLVSELPVAIGLDVIDESVARLAGFPVEPVAAAHVLLQRTIGASEGNLRGRWRNGRVSRWTGYDPGYFLIRLLRYLARRPYVVGSLAMLWGYLSAGSGPFPTAARREFRGKQRAKLRALLSHPLNTSRALYSPAEGCGDPRCCPVGRRRLTQP